MAEQVEIKYKFMSCSRLTDWLEVEVDDDIIEELAAAQTGQVLLRHSDPAFTGRRRILDQPEDHIQRVQSEKSDWTKLLLSIFHSPLASPDLQLF